MVMAESTRFFSRKSRRLPQRNQPSRPLRARSKDCQAEWHQRKWARVEPGTIFIWGGRPFWPGGKGAASRVHHARGAGRGGRASLEQVKSRAHVHRFGAAECV